MAKKGKAKKKAKKKRRSYKTGAVPEALVIRENPVQYAVHPRGPNKKEKTFTFIDLFVGIGGCRMAFEAAGCKCVFSSEWDRFAQKTYETNFGEKPKGDIREILAEEIPDHNILVGGFPCQPFSISGVTKKRALNRPDGFRDPTQGTLFFEIKRIIYIKFFRTPFFRYFCNSLVDLNAFIITLRGSCNG